MFHFALVIVNTNLHYLHSCSIIIVLINPPCRYYAAFPALHGRGASKNPSPSETIWRNNPLVNKSLASLTSEDDSSSANEDAEIRKINTLNTVIIPRHRKPRKNTSRNRQHPTKGRRDKSRGKGRQSQKEQSKPQEFPPWPPGFAKLDPIILQNLDILDENQVFVENSPKRPHDELCTRVESLLKGMLLPAPEKTYKDLLDVDETLPEELREKHAKKSDKSVSSANKESTKGKGGKQKQTTKLPSVSPATSFCEESVSPELKEQEIWYTQPIDVVFHSQEDDVVSNSKLRLYKRNSYPSFSSEAGLEEELGSSHSHSTASSPLSEKRRSLSLASEQSDDIPVDSVLIPAWLTDVISADEHSDDNGEDIDLSTSLKSSSPFPNSFPKSDYPVCLIGNEGKERYGAAWSNDELACRRIEDIDDLFKVHVKHHDDYSTPTPDRGQVESPGSDHQKGRSDSVSLVDWNYMSKFLCDSTPEWQSLSPDDVFAIPSPDQSGVPTLWQSRVLCDFTFDVADTLPDFFQPDGEFCDQHCWQPIGSSPYSQLWDVNQQKRNKMSSWGMPINLSENPVWLAENNLVFMQVSNLEDGKYSNNLCENTLIPQISIDLTSEAETDAMAFKESDIDVDSSESYQYFDRSVSMGDVPSLWDEATSKKSNPQLSKSFELVPSEHSAFYDVPRKLSHVHSEPNLVQYRQEFGDGSQDSNQSPQEHLYFSPKTHFRPITPAYAPELLTPKSKQQLCHDLFGGLPSTKTPTQQYHAMECSKSDEESFIPSFKVKNYSKSIQTGESIDKQESVDESSESEERDTPVILSILEDLMNDNDKDEKLVTINEDLDTANTDSAYETDYGGNQGLENDAERASRASGCVKNLSLFTSQDYSECEAVDHGHLGDVVDFSVESFMATFPHTQDWPDGPCSASLVPSVDNTCVTDNAMTDEDFLKAGWQPFDPNSPVEKTQVAPPFPVTSSGLWGEDLQADHIYDEMEKYKNIWSTAGHEFYSVDVEPLSDSGNHDLIDFTDEVYDNVQLNDEVEPNFQLTPESQTGIEKEEYDNVFTTQGEVAGESMTNIQLGVIDVECPGYAGFPDYCEVGDGGGGSMLEAGNYWSVKLTHKDKQPADGSCSDAQVAIYIVCRYYNS